MVQVCILSRRRSWNLLLDRRPGSFRILFGKWGNIVLWVVCLTVSISDHHWFETLLQRIHRSIDTRLLLDQYIDSFHQKRLPSHCCPSQTAAYARVMWATSQLIHRKMLLCFIKRMLSPELFKVVIAEGMHSLQVCHVRCSKAAHLHCWLIFLLTDDLGGAHYVVGPACHCGRGKHEGSAGNVEVQ